MKRFRISKNDTVKATASSTGTVNDCLLSTIYDSQFTRISQVVNELNRKIPHFSGKKIRYYITLPEKEMAISFVKNVN